MPFSSPAVSKSTHFLPRRVLTLDVLLFQEQLLRIAMIAANFTGGEAEDLRRAMGFKRSEERMQKIQTKLRSGMTANGFSPETQEEIITQI